MATLSAFFGRDAFPVQSAEKEILGAFSRIPCGGSLFLRAEPGSGKTSIIPGLIAEGVSEGLVLVTEPRRLAAVGAARFASSLFGVELGSRIGYAVRGERKDSAETRVLYVTEGMALALLTSESFARKVAVLIIDEFHERHASTDLLLVLARRFTELSERDRMIPRSIFMSATFDEKKCRDLFPGAEYVDVPGKVFDLEIIYKPLPESVLGHLTPITSQSWTDPRYWDFVARTIHDEKIRLQNGGCGGNHILCFLPGKREISFVAERLNELGIESDSLHGERSLNELTESVFGSKSRERALVFLSTNLAESSLTVPGVRTVIDTGIVRLARHHMDSGSIEIFTSKAGRHSLVQRAGRAAREAPGRAVRLYSMLDFEKRPNGTPPEITTSDLSRDLVSLLAVFDSFDLSPPQNEDEWKGLPWLEPPPAERLEHALEILTLVGALDGRGHLSQHGRELANLPLSIRMGSSILVNRDSQLLPQLICFASLLAEGQLRDPFTGRPCDSLAEEYWMMREALGTDSARSMRVRSSPVWKRFYETLKSVCGSLSLKLPGLSDLPENFSERGIALCLLRGFADSVGIVPKDNLSVVRHMNGETYSLVSPSAAGVHLILESVRLHGTTGAKKVVTRSLMVDMVDLFDAPEGYLEEVLQPIRDQSYFRVAKQIRYGKLILSEDVVDVDHDDFQEELSRWLAGELSLRLRGNKDFATLCNRLKAAGCVEAAESIIAFEVSLWRRLAMWLVSHFRSSNLSIKFEIEELVSPKGIHSWACEASVFEQMTRLAPAELSLVNGKKVDVSYEESQPKIRGRIQDFFGQKNHPLIGGRLQVPVVLLAPNGQVAQITSDLVAFWQKSYPEVRRAYLGRYPKHYWPDDPLNAKPYLTKKQVAAGGPLK